MKIAVLVISSHEPPYPAIEEALWSGQPERGKHFGVDVYFLRGLTGAEDSTGGRRWLNPSILVLLEVVSSAVLALGTRWRTSQSIRWFARRICFSDGLASRMLRLETGVSLQGNVIRTFCPERRSLIGWKTLRALEWLHSEGYDFVFRTNSSSYVDLMKLSQLINSGHFPLSGFFGKTGVFFGQPFHSGAGYLLGSEAINQVMARKSRWNHFWLDDVALSALLEGCPAIVHGPLQRLDVSSLKQFEFCSPKELRLHFHFRLKTKNHRETVLLGERFRERYTAITGQ